MTDQPDHPAQVRQALVERFGVGDGRADDEGFSETVIDEIMAVLAPLFTDRPLQKLTDAVVREAKSAYDRDYYDVAISPAPPGYSRDAWALSQYEQAALRRMRESLLAALLPAPPAAPAVPTTDEDETR